MDRIRQQYMFHLDNIRLKKNITIKELCDGICDDRQYRKYRSGDNNISDIRLLEFCEKLGISSRDFYFTLNEKDAYDFNVLKNLYSLIVNHKFSDAKKILDRGFKYSYLTIQNRRLLEYCKIRFFYMQKEFNGDQAVREISKNIDIQKCCKKEVFDFVDVLFLLLLAEIQIKTEKVQALNQLINILNNPNYLYMSPEKRDLIAPIYSNVSVMLGRLNRFNDLLRINSLGIEYCIKNSFSKSLTKLYQTRALALHKLERFSEAHEFIAKSISNSISIESSEANYKLFKQLVKDFY
jgi:transcriptional regulator with XRE-family HTH domain